MNAIVLPIVLPLLAAFLLGPAERVARPLARILGPVTLLVCAAILVNVWRDFGHTPFAIAIGGFVPPFGIALYVDQMALLFALAVPVFGLAFWPRAVADATRQDALMLLLTAAATGMALSGDLFNLYVFYELLAVASYGLIAASGSGAAIIASIRYVLLSGFGSVLALLGIAIVYAKTGTVNLAQLAELAPGALTDPVGLAAFVLLLIGIGVKAELFPVNTWVPEVYAAASGRLAAILAGLVSKLAVIMLLRLLVLVFPETRAAEVMLVLGIAGVVAGELAAFAARDYARMLAFSSIGQLGIVFIAFSVSGEAGVFAGLAVALHHLIVKPALFALGSRWARGLHGLDGAAWRTPVAGVLFVLFAMSLIGVPPLPGFWTKFLVMSGLAQTGDVVHMAAMVAIMAATVVEANYLFRVVARLYTRSPKEPPRIYSGPRDIAVAVVLGAALLAVTVSIAPAATALQRISAEVSNVSAYVATVRRTAGMP